MQASLFRASEKFLRTYVMKLRSLSYLTKEIDRYLSVSQGNVLITA